MIRGRGAAHFASAPVPDIPAGLATLNTCALREEWTETGFDLGAVGSMIAAVPIGRIALFFICLSIVPPPRVALAAAESAAARCPEDDRALLMWAGENLGDFGDKKEAVRTLLTARATEAIACAEADPSLRVRAIRALLTFDGDMDPHIPRNWVAAVERWARGAKPSLFMAHFLAVVGAPRALPLLARLSKKSPELYLSIGRVPGQAARATLETGLRARDAKVRAYAAVALRGHGGAACPILLRRAAQEKEPRALALLLFSLGHLRCAGAPAPALDRVAHNEPLVREGAAAVLARFPDPSHIAVLVKLVRDTNHSVADEAATALFCQPAAAPWVKEIIEAATQVHRSRLIAAAIDRAAAVGDRELFPLAQALLASRAARDDAEALMAALANARPDFQLLSLARMRQLALHGNRANLKECEPDIDCETVAIEAALALTRLHDRATADAFATTLADASQADLKAAALAGLWALSDPRAADFLRKNQADPTFGRYAAAAEAYRANPVPAGEDGVLPVQQRVLDAGTPNARAEIDVTLPPGAPIPAAVSIAVFVRLGDVEFPIDYATQEMTSRHATIVHKLADLREFEREYPLVIRVSHDGVAAALAVPALGSRISFRVTGGETAGSLVRLHSRKEMMMSFTDIAGNVLLNGITPGPIGIEFPDEVPEADDYRPGESDSSDETRPPPDP